LNCYYSIADGHSYKVPSTIDDPAILPEIEDAVAGLGYGKKQDTP
jgi:propionyl-CoA synthetase